MHLIETGLEGCYVLKPKIFEDQRGYFFESYNQKKFKELTGIDVNFIQDNQSKSSKGVLRGLHFQKGEFAQAKLVRVVKGSVQDVVVDLRPKSKTFGNYFSIELSEKNNTQLFIPKDFAHGFLVLEDDTIFSYKCNNYYNKQSETGIIYNDIDLNINWKEIGVKYKLSEKDLKLTKLKSLFL
ncbi:dTDP-4-dehydrorhamnose 3,5-epimerase [Winogradskyella haliclonae]|uniref:dTDP-4-dehydrorhamnose 3,5-epimerase n=1 Tax=Winogradskyella haliclonae TaxID=2048558 RepID=A0ABQ2BV29_9FLAO|nr:dTDP-4-dehydrorhamnose 3,5-epimerase [Winogradskyella haliclonae]GGI56279.1 dTDP-4-dehydrorhamnose 3,5-epimerase [Winogradskyella haliclonae]